MNESMISTGSMLKSSEGLLATLCSAICSSVLLNDTAEPSVQMAAVIGMCVAVSAYAISRGLAKKTV